MYSSMHGEQIEVRQAYAGALSASASKTATASPAAKAVQMPGTIQPQAAAKLQVGNLQK